MHPDAQLILTSLQRVAAERATREADSALGEAVRCVKAFQHARFERTYADLLASDRYRGAARFFLDDLYGPGDFTQRDAQFARIVPALVRLFPGEIVHTVSELGSLHALSEELDSAMAHALRTGGALAGTTASDWGAPDAERARAYAAAWQGVGRAADREQQIRWMVSVGAALDRYTRNPLLRHSLRLMRGPAQAAGLGALQSFLERGFDTFKGMGGASAFLGAIETRERELAQGLFAGSGAALLRLQQTGGPGVADT